VYKLSARKSVKRNENYGEGYAFYARYFVIVNTVEFINRLHKKKLPEFWQLLHIM